MLIEPNDAQYFLKVYKLTLMNFAGKALNTASEFVSARNAFYEKTNENNKFFPKDADDDFRNAIKKTIYDDFIYLQKVRNGYLLRNEKQNNIYLVKAITTPLEEFIEDFSLIPEFCIKITFRASSSFFHARIFLHRWLTILTPIEWTIEYCRVFAQQIEVMNQTIQSLSSAQM